MLKNLFKRNKKHEDNFFGENDTTTSVIGIFKEYGNHNYYREYEFTDEDKIFIGAWICEAKNNNHQYNVIYY